MIDRSTVSWKSIIYIRDEDKKPRAVRSMVVISMGAYLHSGETGVWKGGKKDRKSNFSRRQIKKSKRERETDTEESESRIAFMVIGVLRHGH